MYYMVTDWDKDGNSYIRIDRIPADKLDRYQDDWCMRKHLHKTIKAALEDLRGYSKWVHVFNSHGVKKFSVIPGYYNYGVY